MELRVAVGGAAWVVDDTRAEDWTVPVRFDADATEAFGLANLRRAPVAIGGGRHLLVQEGAGVNCADVTFNPHGSGTHTEGLGHVSQQWRTLESLALPPLLPATVVTVAPVRLGTTNDTYLGTCDVDDRVVPVGPLARAVSELTVTGFDQALVIRTQEDSEPRRRWSETNPPYLTHEAMAFVAGLATRHLLVDVPSVDREDDGGEVLNHRRWWGFPPGSRDGDQATHPHRTLTELLHVPPHCPDGAWMLCLQPAALQLDAAPSRVQAFRPWRPS